MTIPPTNNILESLKHLFINTANPFDMGIDVYDGLKEKEQMLSMITHELLIDTLGNDQYLEVENEVAQSIGKNGLIDILCGDHVIVDPTIIDPPTLNFYIVIPEENSGSSSSSQPQITEDSYFEFFIIGSGGSLALTNFSHHVEVLLKPYNSQVDWIEDDHIEETSYYETVGRVRFSDPGRYTLELTLQHVTQEAYFFKQVISVEVF